jgi:acetyl esterase/lipase
MKKTLSRTFSARPGLAAVLVAAASLAAGALCATAQGTAAAARNLPLWNGPAPLATGTNFGTETQTTDIPSIDVFLPAANPTKTAVLVIPGGGYMHEAINKEGTMIAQWLNAHGIAAFVLHYRVSPYTYPAPLLDGMRALRVIRSRAAEFGIGEDHIGVWGFSAGGHLSSVLATHFDETLPGTESLPTDAIDKLSDKPAFAVLSYPVISMDPSIAHMGSHDALLGKTPDPKMVALFSSELQVSDETPPVFLFATTDDKTVPVMNSVRFYEACAAHHVEVEMHLYEHGPHGMGLAQGRPGVELWTQALAAWMQIHGWMARQ